MKEKLLDALKKNLEHVKKNGTNDYHLFVEIKTLDELNPGLVNSLGWVECFYSCVYLPKEEIKEIFTNFNHFKNREYAPLAVSKEAFEIVNNKLIYFDEVNKCYFLQVSEPPIKVWANIEDNKLRTTCSSYAKNSKLFTSRVSRRNDVYSLWNTHFKEHSAANKKEFVVPNGECFGVEIEMLFKDVFGKLRFSLFVGQNFPAWICERDGSLEDRGDAGDCGLELVSPPLPEQELLEQIKVITEEAKKHGANGHNAGIWYGMHINVNIYGRNHNLTAAKFINLINDPKLRTFWQNASRRKGESVEMFCQFQPVTLADCLATESYDHYRATFYRNGKNCVEVRIFRSNLRHLTIKCSVELLRIALNFCMSEEDFNNYSKFREMLINGSADLQEYLFNFRCIQELDKLVNNEGERKYTKKPALFID